MGLRISRTASLSLLTGGAVVFSACTSLPAIDRAPQPGILSRALNDASASQGSGPFPVDGSDDWSKREPVVLRLALSGCLELAATRNRELLLESINQKLGEADVIAAGASTDLLLTSSLAVDRSERAIQSRFVGDSRTREKQTTTNGDIALKAPFVTGTTITVDHSLSRVTTNSPFNTFEWNSSLGLNVRQNLLDGFGVDINRTELDMARRELEARTLEGGAKTNEVAFAICEAYWNLVLAREDLGVLERQRDAARLALERSVRRAREGLDRGLEELRAKSTLSERERDIIGARLEVDRKSDALLRAMHPDLLYGYGLVRGFRLMVEPRDALAPEIAAVPVPNAFDEIRAAFGARKDLRAAIARLESQGLRVRQTANRLLPKLEAELGATARGSADSYGKTLDGIKDVDSRTYRVGLSFEIPLENSSDRANEQKARLQLEQQTVRLRDLEATILSDVVDSIRTIESGNRDVAAAKEASALANEEFEATKYRLEIGLGTSFEVKQAEADKTAKERDLIRARVRLELSRLRLLKARGTLAE
jgi:outer membrane protein